MTVPGLSLIHIYTAAEQKAFGYAYARGILKTAGIADKGMSAGASGTGTSGSYLIKVTITDLYIRKGPGKNYANKGFIKPGVYTLSLIHI